MCYDPCEKKHEDHCKCDCHKKNDCCHEKDHYEERDCRENQRRKFNHCKREFCHCCNRYY
jgi:hypothetical protein